MRILQRMASSLPWLSQMTSHSSGTFFIPLLSTVDAFSFGKIVSIFTSCLKSLTSHMISYSLDNGCLEIVHMELFLLVLGGKPRLFYIMCNGQDAGQKWFLTMRGLLSRLKFSNQNCLTWIHLSLLCSSSLGTENTGGCSDCPST